MITGSVSVRSYVEDVERHSHPYHQIVLPRRGKLALEVEGRVGLVTAGLGAYIVAGAQHAFQARGANAFVIVDVPSDQDSADRLAQSFTDAAFFPVTRAIQALLDYLDAASVAASPTAAWSTLLLDSMTHHRSASHRDEIALRRAMDFMRDRFAGPIRVADVARAAGVSETRLHVVFRARLDQTPYAVLAALRLSEARRLLVGTELSIAEIALRTGHSDQSALTRRLHLADGTTPAALRRACRSVH